MIKRQCTINVAFFVIFSWSWPIRSLEKGQWARWFVQGHNALSMKTTATDKKPLECSPKRQESSSDLQRTHGLLILSLKIYIFLRNPMPLSHLPRLRPLIQYPILSNFLPYRKKGLIRDGLLNQDPNRDNTLTSLFKVSYNLVQFPLLPL